LPIGRPWRICCSSFPGSRMSPTGDVSCNAKMVGNRSIKQILPLCNFHPSK
jgi:hypothetical protein